MAQTHLKSVKMSLYGLWSAVSLGYNCGYFVLNVLFDEVGATKVASEWFLLIK